MPVKTIFFDVGNTLLFPNRAHILAPLQRHKVSPSLERWHAIERVAKKKFDEVMEHGGPPDYPFWSMFYTDLLGQLQIIDDPLHAGLVEATRHSANWCEIRSGTRENLERLRQQYRLAVISNADGKIEAVLKRCGIADCFESITDSGIVGYEKPHPTIFDAALRAMKAPAAESLYVGDVYSVDYLGATRAGMQGILFDVSGAYRDLGLPRVESLEELERKLS
jgi:putative hydrolase of the HAD superfamily